MTVAPRGARTGLRANAGAPDAPIEVMHVITSLDVGGAETMLAQLAVGDTAGPVSHSVVSLKPGGALRASLKDAGIPVTDVGVGRRRGALTGIVRLAGLIRSRRPAVVHTWLYHADLLATLGLLLSGRWRATRLVWGVRCSDMDMRRYPLSTRCVLKLLPLLSARTDLVLCNSDAGRAVHERLGYRPSRWRVIPNGVNVDRFRPRPGERAAIRAELGLDDMSFAVGMCARVDPMKDHDNFVKAAAAFAEAAPEARFVVVGAGTDELGSALDRAIAASGIAGRFVRLGQRQDIDRIHSALDVATLSSAFGEGFPNVLAEAMACGVPCVATDVGDSASIIGDTGLVVPARNAKALSAAWESIWREGCAHRATRGAAARQRVASRYAVAPMVEAYRTQYRECVLSGGARDDESSVPPKPLDDPLAREAEPTPDPIDAHQSKRPGGSRNKFGMRTAAVVAATAVCMALAFRTVDVGAVGQALSRVEPRYAALAVVLLLCNSLIAMARFRVVLGGFGYAPAWRPLISAFSVGLLGNQFVLNIIGQSVGRAGALTSYGVPFGATIIATFVERVLAAGVLAVAGVAAAWVLLPQLGFDFAQGGAYFIFLGAGMTTAACTASVAVYRRGAIVRSITAVWRALERFSSAALLTVLAHVFMLGGYVSALLAVGLESPTLEIAGALVIVMFVSGLPISLGGWGVRELSAVAALGVVGIEAPMALAAALAVGLLSLGVNLAIAFPGLFLFLVPGRKVEQAAEGGNRSTRWNARLITGCTALTAVAIFFQVRLQSGNGQITANVADLFALIGLGTLVLLLASSRNRFIALPRPMTWPLLGLSLLLAYGLVLGYASFGANGWALMNRGFGWLIILGYVALGLSIALVDAERGRRLVLRLFVAAGTAIAVMQLVILVAVVFGFDPPREAFPIPLRGYANNANAFAFQMTMTAIAAIVANRLGVLGRGQRWLVTVLILTGLATYFSGSRTGMGMFAMLLVMSVAFAQPDQRSVARSTAIRSFTGIVLGAVAIVNIPLAIATLNMVLSKMTSLVNMVLSMIASLTENTGWKIDSVLEIPSASGDIWIRTSVLHPVSETTRWQTYVDGWHLWTESPIFGQGLGAYVESQVAVAGPLLVHHSVPLWLMAEMGLIGLAVGIAVFGYLALSAIRLMRDPVHWAWGAGLLMVLLCWGAASQLHDFAFQRTFWFFIALAFGLSPAAWPADPRRSQPGSGARRSTEPVP